MRFAKTCVFFLGVAWNAQSVFALDTKVSCAEVETTEAKCKEFDAETAKCDAEVQAGIKAKIEVAKTAADECKKKNGIGYLLKCKKEMTASASAINTPKQVAGSPIQKELSAKPETSCAKADVMGSANIVCKGPKKILEAMKKNCIKDPAK